MSAKPAAPKAKRERKPPKAGRNPDAAVLLVMDKNGFFHPVGPGALQIIAAKKISAGVQVMAYLYQVRSARQWRKAHGLGCALIENVEGFEGLGAHDALKKLQVDGNIACEPRRFPVPGPVQELLGVTHINLPVPRSLAFDEMDESEFQLVYGQMLNYVRTKYWPALDAGGQQGLQRLLGMGS